MAYFLALPVVPLLTVKDSEYVRWHARNGLVLNILGGALLLLAAFVPWGTLTCCVFGVAFPSLGVLEFVAIAKALSGERWRIPFVTDLAEKL